MYIHTHTWQHTTGMPQEILSWMVGVGWSSLCAVSLKHSPLICTTGERNQTQMRTVSSEQYSVRADCKWHTATLLSHLHALCIFSLHACNMSSFFIQQSRENCIQYLPIRQSVIQDSIICPQNKHYVKPSLWEELTAMIVNNLASLSHAVLYLIYELQQTYTVHVLNHKFQLYHTHRFPLHPSTMYIKYCQLRYRVAEIYRVLEEWDAFIFRVGIFYWIKDHYTWEDTVQLP